MSGRPENIHTAFQVFPHNTPLRSTPGIFAKPICSFGQTNLAQGGSFESRPSDRQETKPSAELSKNRTNFTLSSVPTGSLNAQMVTVKQSMTKWTPVEVECFIESFQSI